MVSLSLAAEPVHQQISMHGDKLLYNTVEACQVLALSRSELRREIERGRLACVHKGRLIRITRRALEEYVTLLETAERGL